MRLLGSLIVPLVGIVFLGLGGWWGWDTWTFVKRAEPAIGRVERFVQSASKRRVNGVTRESTTHYPVFSFRDAKGTSHMVTSSTGSGKPAYEAGQEVPVLYDPAAPDSARINSFSNLWLFPVAFCGIAVACLVVAPSVCRWTT